MSRFRRTPQTDRYYQTLDQDGIQQHSEVFAATPSQSVVLAGQKCKVGTLVTGLQRADEEGLKIREAIKAKKDERRIRLNVMKLQDKQFELDKNVYNIAVGQIIDRQDYLQKLSSQVRHLRGLAKQLQQEQENRSKTISQDKYQSCTFGQTSRTIDGRKSLCGRFYSRMQTPSSERRYGRFRNTKNETSSYYKWRPEVEENQIKIAQKPNKNVETTRSVVEKRSISHKAQSQKLAAQIRIKPRTAKMSTNSNQENILIEDHQNVPQLTKKVKTNENGPVKTHKTQKTDYNPEIQQQNISKKTQTEEQPQFQPYQGILFKGSSEHGIKDINAYFRNKILKQLQIPQGFPMETLEHGLTIDELWSLGRKVYRMFGIETERETNKMVTRRFKNGVYYHLSAQKNILWYYSGTFYIGGWDTELPTEGQKQGLGFQYVPQKYIYLGQFKDGMKHGKGSIQIFSENPDTPQEFMGYEGEWFEGKPHGHGNHIDENNTKYMGDFVLGEKTGKAKIMSIDGLYYDGEVVKGIKHGKGFEKLVNGDSYQGDFVDGKFEGRGLYKWKNGSSYRGQFMGGKRQGMGLFISANGDQFEGEYFQDIKNGWGKFTWANGQIYQGQFRNDIRHGEGTYRHPSGKVGKFMWKDGQIEYRLYCRQEEEYRARNLREQKLQQ